MSSLIVKCFFKIFLSQQFVLHLCCVRFRRSVRLLLIVRIGFYADQRNGCSAPLAAASISLIGVKTESENQQKPDASPEPDTAEAEYELLTEEDFEEIS